MLPKNITIPNLNGKTTEGKINDLLQTVIQLQKQLNYALKNIDTDNLSKGLSDAVKTAVADSNGLNRKVSLDSFMTYVRQTERQFSIIADTQKNIYSGEIEPIIPEGTEKQISDLWVRNIKAKTCQDLLDLTCQQLLDNFTCDEMLNGSNSIYTWDGSKWVLGYNSSELSRLATELTQTAEQLALKASQTTVDAQGQRLSSAEASILLNAAQILLRVEKNGIVSAINQTAEEIKIQADRIALEGLITANGNVKILTDGSIDAAGKFRSGNWKFDDQGATYTENGTVLFQILMDSAQGAAVSADLTKRLFLMGREMYFYNDATSGAVILGQDADAGYVQQCFYPTQTRTGNLGTPSHIWDTASIRAVFRESEGGLSSRKIKKGIRELKSVSKIVDALKAVTFIYRGDPRQKRHYGMIYEDTEKVAPLLCVQLKDDDTNPRNFGIDYSSMTVLLLKEVQDLRKRVAVLEKKGA